MKWALLWFNVPETWTSSAAVELQQNLTSSRTQNMKTVITDEPVQVAAREFDPVIINVATYK